MSHPIHYATYMNSDQWRAKRKAYIRKHNPTRCVACLTEWCAGSHLHHVTYKRLGNESMNDLMPLCQPCHTAIHQAHQDSTDTLRQVSHQYVDAQQAKRKRRAKRTKHEPAPDLAGHGSSSVDRYARDVKRRSKKGRDKTSSLTLRERYLLAESLAQAAKERRLNMT